MEPNYLLVAFDTDKPALPSTAMHKYIPKRTWQSLAETELIEDIVLGDLDYRITWRGSYVIGNLSGKTLVLQILVKRNKTIVP